MPETRVVNLRFRFEKYDVRIDRKTKWGNPFVIGPDGTREEVIAKYREYIQGNPDLLAALPELKGKVLGCWCKPAACHGDVLVELVIKHQETAHVSGVGVPSKSWWCIMLPKWPRLYVEWDAFDEVSGVAKIIAKKKRHLLIRVSKSGMPQKLILLESVTLCYSTPADPRPEVVGPIAVYVEGRL